MKQKFYLLLFIGSIVNAMQVSNNFAEKINRLLADEDLANAMGKAGRQRVLEKFSWESIAKTTFNYYEEVISKFEKEKA